MKKKSFMKSKKVCHLSKKEFSSNGNEKSEFKLYHKVRDHCYYTAKFRGAAHSICNLKYEVSKEILVVIHNGSTYDRHFIIKPSTEVFQDNFKC